MAALALFAPLRKKGNCSAAEAVEFVAADLKMMFH
jgi:hypothetical protein